MSDSERHGEEPTEGESGGEAAPEKLHLAVKVDVPSTCERHVTVTIPREDIDRYFDKAFSDLRGTAAVPGFRAGRAPRKLIEARFRKDVANQVKGELLVDSLTQITEEKFSPISEPDFNPEAVELPADGPMTFEFDLEVRPEFDLPEWKGLSIERPQREFSKEDVDKQLENVLARHGRLVPIDEPAKSGDYITCNLTFKSGDEVIAQSKEEVIRIRPVLSFRDGKVEKFDKLMKGARPGDTKEADTKLSGDAPNEALRGKKITAVFEVLDVKKLELPELTPALLRELGEFESEADLRDAVLDSLKRQHEYEQRRAARRQITASLLKGANWELPPSLLKRQSHRELDRAVLELRHGGFSDAEIQARENELRQNIAASTTIALKEHFILERVAEEEKIDIVERDYDQEIAIIAAQTGESPRRVRARLEKKNLIDVLRNQIIERKVIERVLEHARFKDVPYQAEHADVEALDRTAGGGQEEESEIPVAQHPDLPEPLPTSVDRK